MRGLRGMPGDGALNGAPPPDPRIPPRRCRPAAGVVVGGVMLDTLHAVAGNPAVLAAIGIAWCIFIGWYVKT